MIGNMLINEFICKICDYSKIRAQHASWQHCFSRRLATLCSQTAVLANS